MKVLTAEETNKMITIPRGRATKIYGLLCGLQVGEGLHITRDDWWGKHAPYRIVNAFAKKSGRSFHKGRLHDNSGWLVKRVG